MFIINKPIERYPKKDIYYYNIGLLLYIIFNDFTAFGS